MKIREKGSSSPYFFEADDGVAKELIERGDWEEVTEKAVPSDNSVRPQVETKTSKTRRKKA